MSQSPRLLIQLLKLMCKRKSLGNSKETFEKILKLYLLLEIVPKA